MLSNIIRRGITGAALAAVAFLAIPAPDAEAQSRYRRSGYSRYYRPVPPSYGYRPVQSYRPVYVNPYGYPAYRVPSYTRYYNSYRVPGGYGVGGYPIGPSYGGGGFPVGPSYGGGGFGIYIGR